MVDHVLTSYQSRLDAWRFEAFDGVFPRGSLGDLSPKFHPSGAAKSFYGLTVVAFIDRDSELYQKLGDFQNRIKTALKKASLESTFSFLDPISFHMTLCDIAASPTPIPIPYAERIIQTAREIFPQLGKYPDLSCKLTNMGVDISLLLLAQFETEACLKDCLTLEKRLKDGLEVDERSFLGHVSLAYFVKPLGSEIEQIKNTLRPFSREALGKFPITKISLCSFRDMNNYTPLMSIDLLDGTFNDYSRTIDFSTLQ